MNDIGFFGLMDDTISFALETTPEEYTRVIEEKCSYSEAKFIILAILSDREDKIEKAKQLFKTKVEQT